jgi:hypothetical protein
MTSGRFFPLTVMTFCGAMQGLQSQDGKPIQWKYLLPAGLVSSYLTSSRARYLAEKEEIPSIKQILAKATPRQLSAGLFLGGILLNTCYAGLGYAGASMFYNVFVDPSKTLE